MTNRCSRGVLTVFALLIIAQSSCSLDEKPHMCDKSTQRYDNVVRVYIRSPGLYTVLVAKDGSAELEERHFGGGAYTGWEMARLFADVPREQGMWARRTYAGRGVKNGHFCWYNVEIHIHVPSDVGGGGRLYWKLIAEEELKERETNDIPFPDEATLSPRLATKDAATEKPFHGRWSDAVTFYAASFYMEAFQPSGDTVNGIFWWRPSTDSNDRAALFRGKITDSVANIDILLKDADANDDFAIFDAARLERKADKLEWRFRYNGTAPVSLPKELTLSPYR